MEFDIFNMKAVWYKPPGAAVFEKFNFV